MAGQTVGDECLDSAAAIYSGGGHSLPTASTPHSHHLSMSTHAGVYDEDEAGDGGVPADDAHADYCTVNYTFQLDASSQVLAVCGADETKAASPADFDTCSGELVVEVTADTANARVNDLQASTAPAACDDTLTTAAASADRLDVRQRCFRRTSESGGCRRRRVAVVLNERGEAAAVPLHSVVAPLGLSRCVLVQPDGQPVILDVLDAPATTTAGRSTTTTTTVTTASSRAVLSPSANNIQEHQQQNCTADTNAERVGAAVEAASSRQSTVGGRERRSWVYGGGGGSGAGEHKLGMWSREEVDTLVTNIDAFCQKHNVAEPHEVIFRWAKSDRQDFYRFISHGIDRPLFSIYRRVIRMYDRQNYMGRYSSDELHRLQRLRAEHGNNWQTIGRLLGRSAASVKDRARVLREHCNEGRWSAQEEQILCESVCELTESASEQCHMTCDINWADVAAKVQTRSEKQCRSKWLNNLGWRHAGGHHWTRYDDVALIETLHSLEVTDEQQVDWRSLFASWPRRSARSPQWLRGRWWHLKNHVPDHRTLSYREILEAVRHTPMYLSAVASMSETNGAGAAASQSSPPLTITTSAAANHPPRVVQIVATTAGQPAAAVATVCGSGSGVVLTAAADPSGVLLAQSACMAMSADDTAAYLVDPLTDVNYGAATAGGGVFASHHHHHHHMLTSSAVSAHSHHQHHHVIVDTVDAAVSQSVYSDGGGAGRHDDREDNDGVNDEEPLKHSSITDESVMRGDPILSHTAPSVQSEEEASLDGHQ